MTRYDAADEAKSDALALARARASAQVTEDSILEVRMEEMRARVMSAAPSIPLKYSEERRGGSRPSSTGRSRSASYPRLEKDAMYRDGSRPISAVYRGQGTGPPAGAAGATETLDQRRSRRRFEAQQSATRLRVRLLQNSGVDGAVSRQRTEELEEAQAVRGSMLDSLIRGDLAGAEEDLASYEKRRFQRLRRQREEAANMTGRVTWVAPLASDRLRSTSHADPTRASLSRMSGRSVRTRNSVSRGRAPTPSDRMAPNAAKSIPSGSRGMSRTESPEHFREARGMPDEDRIAQQLRVRRGSAPHIGLYPSRFSSPGFDGAARSPTKNLSESRHVPFEGVSQFARTGTAAGAGVPQGAPSAGWTRPQAEAFDHTAAMDRNHASELLEVLYTSGYKYFACLLAATGLGEELEATRRPPGRGLSARTQRYVILAPVDVEISGHTQESNILGRTIRRFGLEGVLCSGEEKPWPDMARYIGILRKGFNLDPENPDVIATVNQLCQHIWDVGSGQEGKFVSVVDILRKVEADSLRRVNKAGRENHGGMSAADSMASPECAFPSRVKDMLPKTHNQRAGGPTKGDMEAAFKTLKLPHKSRASEVHYVTISNTEIPLLLDPRSLPVERPDDVGGDRLPTISIPSGFWRHAGETPNLLTVKLRGGAIVDIVPCQGLTHAPYERRTPASAPPAGPPMPL